MLLYDRVFEQLTRALNNAESQELEEEVYQRDPGYQWCLHLDSGMSGGSVYDLSNVIPLFSDWQRERDRRVSKRPPNTNVWCEWPAVEARHGWENKYVVGVLFHSIPLADGKSYFLQTTLRTAEGGETDAQREASRAWFSEVLEVVSRADEFFMGSVFRQLISTTDPVQLADLRRAGLRLPVTGYDSGEFLAVMADDYSTVRFTKHPRMKGAYIPGMPELQMPYFVESDPAYTPWPPFMAFALLHCKNIVTEEHVPDAKTQRRAEKGGCPPRTSYKTLRVEVPATVHKRQGYDPGEDDSGPKVRFHLCSGHFKNLQHERYKNKGWHWWPAHWRGSKDLGTVEKRYELHGS